MPSRLVAAFVLALAQLACNDPSPSPPDAAVSGGCCDARSPDVVADTRAADTADVPSPSDGPPDGDVGGCVGAPPAGGCVTGAVNGCCDDVERPYACVAGVWRCPSGAVPFDSCCGYGFQCRPYPGPPKPACTSRGDAGDGG